MEQTDLSTLKNLEDQGELKKYGYHPAMEKVHLQNSHRLKKIINKYGFPTIDKVGEKVHIAAWRIVQHAISDPSFMCDCYRLIQSGSKTKIPLKSIAYLSDRISFFRRKPQKYGTQFDYGLNGKFGVWWLEMPQNIDALRVNAGLPPLKKVEQYFSNNEDISEAQALKMRSEQEAWLMKVGWCTMDDIIYCKRFYGN
ncbi:hypothetical protein SRRS_35590 [Sporomusa rhizae]